MNRRTSFSIPSIANFLACVLLAAITAGLASAGTIGPDCNSCDGGIYTLSYSNLQTSGGTTTLDVLLSIDASNVSATLGATAYVRDVAVKVSSSLNTSASSLTHAPVNLVSWSMVQGGLNAGGCSGAGSGYACAAWMGSGPGVAAGNGTLDWTFHLSIPSGALITSPLGDSIKVRYVNSSAAKIGSLVSEGITLSEIPEPSTYALCALGLLLASWRMRRR
jgi:hypothetical protein